MGNLLDKILTAITPNWMIEKIHRTLYAKVIKCNIITDINHDIKRVEVWTDAYEYYPDFAYIDQHCPLDSEDLVGLTCMAAVRYVKSVKSSQKAFNRYVSGKL